MRPPPRRAPVRAAARRSAHEGRRVKLTRRDALALAGGAACASLLSGSSPATEREPRAIAPSSDRLPFFDTRDPGATRFGRLTFRSGIEINAPERNFGGFSGLWRSPDGGRIVAVTDNSSWMTADIVSDAAGIAGLENVVIAPILGPDGNPLERTRYYDIEAVTFDGDTAYIAIEVMNAVMRFDFGREGPAGRGSLVPVPEEARPWPHNRGPEAIGVAPAASPASGSLVIIAERARRGADAPTQGAILDGERRGMFDVARHDGFDITDMEFLPEGDILLLERRYRMMRGIWSRIRRIPGGMLAPGALLDGPVIFEADSGHQIDNMEGLAKHREADGTVILTIVADNNFSILQRNLLLEFVLEPEQAA